MNRRERINLGTKRGLVETDLEGRLPVAKTVRKVTGGSISLIQRKERPGRGQAPGEWKKKDWGGTFWKRTPSRMENNK